MSPPVFVAKIICRSKRKLHKNRVFKCIFTHVCFVHSKLFVVDDAYVQIGSANLDPRSLRLNFELMIEIYDSKFANTMLKHFDQSMMNAQPISYRDIADRNVFYRLRDALAWLLSPFL